MGELKSSKKKKTFAIFFTSNCCGFGLDMLILVSGE